MDTEMNYDIQSVTYETDDGQIIEVFAVPQEESVDSENEQSENETSVDLSSIETILQYQNDCIDILLDDLNDMQQSIVEGWSIATALAGILIGFLACKELLKIWLS